MKKVINIKITRIRIKPNIFDIEVLPEPYDNNKAMRDAKNVTGIEEIMAVYESTPSFFQTGTNTIDAPTPKTPMISPPKKPAIMKFHIFLLDILSVSLRNTNPYFCFSESLVAI